MNKKRNTRKVQAEERRLQILDVALNVFASKGFKGTSIKDIAEASGMSVGLMYHYFSSKEKLLEAVVRHHSFVPQITQIVIEEKELPLDEIIKDLALRFLNILDNNTAMTSIVMREAEINPSVRVSWGNLSSEVLTRLKEYIDSQVSNGKLRPHNTEVTARNILYIAFMSHYSQDFDQSSLTKDEFIRESVINMLHGISITK